MTISPTVYANATAFLVGALMPFTINVVGQLPLAELILLGLAGLVILNLGFRQQLPAAFRSRLLWLFLGCLAVVLCSYVAADVYRESASRDMARGWSRLIFLAI